MPAKKYVLLVDHNLPFANAFRDHFLKKHPHTELEIVDNAKAALRRLSTRPCDLVVADLRLPEVDGLQLLLRLRQSHPNLTKVVMAAHASPRDSQKALEYGSVSYVEKPATEPDYDVAVGKIAQILAQTPEVRRGGISELGLEETAQGAAADAGCTVMCFGADNAGSIIVDGGRIVHAETLEKRGSDALKDILAWEGGLYERRPFREPARRTLDASWQEVLATWIGEKRIESAKVARTPPPGAARMAGDSDQVMPAPPQGDVTARLKPAPAEVAASPFDIPLNEDFLKKTGLQFALQIDNRGKVQQQAQCPDVKLLTGVATFTAAKARELAQLFQWPSPVSVHFALGPHEMASVLFPDKTILLGWVAGQNGVIDAINLAFQRDTLDQAVATKPRLAGTIDAMKKMPGLHGYAIFNKDHQILVKKFSADWGFDLLQGTSRIVSQLCMVLSLQKLAVKLAQVKFEAGSIFAIQAGDLLLLVISHPQAKVQLLKDCLLRITNNEINKAVL